MMKMLRIFSVGVLLCIPVAEVQANELGSGSVKRLAGKAVKKVALPATAVFLAVDAQAAYDDNCSHLTENEATACTTQYFVSGQIEDLKQMARDTELVVKYVVVPKAKNFWDENGDDIKAGAAKTADVLLNTTADAFIALDRFIDGL